MGWYKRQNKAGEAVKSGAEIDVEVGGRLEIAGVDKTAAVAAAVTTPVAGVAAGYKLVRGVHETVAASDDVDTGLATVVAAVASLEDAPGLDPMLVQAVVGDQAGNPDAGHILIKSWKATAVDNCTPVAATTFAKKVSWVAIGT